MFQSRSENKVIHKAGRLDLWTSLCMEVSMRMYGPVIYLSDLWPVLKVLVYWKITPMQLLACREPHKINQSLKKTTKQTRSRHWFAMMSHPDHSTAADLVIWSYQMVRCPVHDYTNPHIEIGVGVCFGISYTRKGIVLRHKKYKNTENTKHKNQEIQETHLLHLRWNLTVKLPICHWLWHNALW